MNSDGIKYDITAIATKYKGFNFRSRLEAKWAAFFDGLGWKWDYEPVEYNGWFPDFSIRGDEGNVILVEVNPVYALPDGLQKRLSEINADGNEILVAGLSCDCIWLYDGGNFGGAVYGRWEKGAGKIGFCHEYNSFSDRISGGYDGGCQGSLRLPHGVVENIWAQACNIVQWVKSDV